MKQKLFAFLLFCICCSPLLRAQTTETFESYTTGKPTAFTSGGQPFTLVTNNCATGGTFGVFIPGQTWSDCNGTHNNFAGAYGVGTSCTAGNCPGTSNNFIDAGTASGTNQQYSIRTTNSALFTIKSLHVYVSTNNGTNPAAAGVVFTGKKAGVGQFTVTISSGLNTSFALNNGFTYIDFTTAGGSNNSTINIDELQINGSNGENYLAVDNFTFGPAVTLAPEINVQGNSTTIADGDATPSAADHSDFGSQSVCSGTIVRTFSIQNTGTAALAISSVNISGTHSADFSVTAAPASSVAAGGSTTFQITFNPSASGARNATITVNSDDSDEAAYDFAITGTGTDPEINVQGNSTSIADEDLTPSVTDHTDFGSQSVCSGTIVRTFTIQNSGTSNLTISGVGITGPQAADFSVTTAPASTISSGGSTTFQVTFNPSALGTRSANINISNSDCDEPTYNFSIQGTGIDPEINVQGNSTTIADGDATPSATDHSDFGSQSVCSGTIVRTFTIQNTGSSNLVISSVNITGTAAADFSVSTSPSSPVSASGSTTFQVTFNPSASGARNATITIGNNDCDEATYDFAITGTGTDPEMNVQGNSTTIADGDATPAAADHSDFGSQGVCSGTITRTFTIQNTGNTNLTISSVIISGTNASDFTVTTAPATTIAAASSTTFQVTFDASATGARNAIITINNNDCDEAAYDFAITANGVESEINIQGNSVSIADGDNTPSLTDHTDFGSASVCSGLVTRTFTIQNTGNAFLSIGSTGVSGSGFFMMPVSIVTLAPGASQTFSVDFNPGSAGVSTGTVTINSGDCDESVYDFVITGTGVDPEINVQGNSTTIADGDATPSAADHSDFGSQSVCSGTIIRTFTIQNTGTSNLTISSVTITGTGSADYAVTTSPSSPVAAGGSTTFQVTFNPSASGARNATITINTDDCDEAAYDFAITGTGADPEINVQGNSTTIADGDATPAATDHTDFGSQSVCSGTVVRTFTIQNTGTSNLTISSVTITGAGSADYAVTTSPSSPVAAGGSTTFQVTFNPSASGARNATITINTDDCDEAAYDFAITGTGTDPEINVQGNSTTITDGDATPAATDHTSFGTQAVCSGTITRTFTIQNTGNANLTVSSVNITGAAAADFSVSTSPSSSVSAAGSTTFQVTFNPSADGARNATITINTNDCDEAAYDFAITGTGSSVALTLSGSTNPTCNGGTNGTATVNTATGGAGGYTYSWAPSGGTGTTATGLGAGTYTCTVTDAATCTATATVTLTEPTVLTASSSATSILCNGGNAVVTVSATGGTGAYTGTGTYTVTAGTYTYTVTDANSCPATTTITVSQPTALAASSSATAILCNGGNAVVTVSATGGTGIYTGTGTYTVTAGTYTYTVTDANSCPATTTITISEPTALSASSSATTILCNGGNAVVTVSATGGTGAYTGTGTYTVTAGTYTYTVTDANSCPATTTITVSEPTALSASSSATAILCNGGTADLTVSATGGTGAYTGTGTYTVTAGTYTYTVTDANSCPATTTITVSEPTALSATSSASAILCNGGTSTVSVLPSGGTLPYTVPGSPTVTAGTYTYTVVDGNGCSTTTSFIVTEPTAITSTVSTIGSNCNTPNGSATVSASGGTGTLTYSWSSGGSASTETGLVSGSYTVTITDDNGCTATDVASVSDIGGPMVNTNPSNVSCFGMQDGSVNNDVTGGTLPYTYNWSNSETTEDVNGLAVGTYTYSVTDAAGCVATGTVLITGPAAIDVSTSVTSETITATATGASYQWIDCSSGTVIAGETGQSYTATANGDYAVIVTLNSCADTSACVNISGIGLASVKDKAAVVKIYPNPSNGMYTVELSAASEVSISNALGNVILKQNMNAGSQTLNLHEEANGVYFMNVKTTDGSRIIKLVKQD